MVKGEKSLTSKLTCLLFLGLFLELCSGGNLWAEARKEYIVKAAFVYNFVKFTTWQTAPPAASDDTYHLCVIADQSLKPAFSTIEGKEIGKHPLSVHHRKPIDRLDGCDILFISRDIGEKATLAILAAVRKKPVLTIGETANFAKSGGVINLVGNKKGGLSFEINRATAQQQQVRFSSRLLNLATLVDDSGTVERRGQE